MSFGPSPAERNAQSYNQAYQNALPQYMAQANGYMSQGMQGMLDVNNNITAAIPYLGRSVEHQRLGSLYDSILNGGYGAATGQAYGASAASAAAQQAQAQSVAMQGQTFAQQFGSDLGGLALQQRNMQTVADKLASTTENPFAVLTAQAREDAALQNSQGMQQLRTQMAAQGLDTTSGTGAAALAALQFNTNKQVADAARQNAVQGAQFQQQGLGMAGGLYSQMAGLDLQRASTQAQLGLQGYGQDVQNAQRLDQVALQNAQMGTQANLQNAQLATQANLQNAQLQTQASLANAQGQNSLIQAALAGQGNLLSLRDNAILQAYGLQSNNLNSIMGMGGNMWGTTLGAQGQYGQQLAQSAAANAQGRGQLLGGLLQGGLGLAGTILGGPPGGVAGTFLGSLLSRGFSGGGGAGMGGFSSGASGSYGPGYSAVYIPRPAGM